MDKISPADLERGYLDTGYVPEEGDDLSKLDQMAKDEAAMEKNEVSMAKKYGWPVEEQVGGFLERGNLDDRY